MLLKHKIKTYKGYIGIGQLSLLSGLLLSLLSRADRLEQAFANPSTGAFMVGLLAGLSAVLFGVSIVFNIKGMQMYRTGRSEH